MDKQPQKKDKKKEKKPSKPWVVKPQAKPDATAHQVMAPLKPAAGAPVDHLKKDEQKKEQEDGGQ